MSSSAAALARLRSALARRDLPAAQSAASAVLATAPDDPEVLAWSGLAEAAGGHHVAAQALLRRAVTLAPDDAFAWRNLAAVEEALGNAAASATALVFALVAMPNAPIEALVDAAARALASGSAQLAAAPLARALALDPSHREALRLEVVRLDAQARTVDAQVVADRLLALAPDDAGALAAFAAVWSKASTDEGLGRGLAAAERLLKRTPEHANALESAAWCLHKLGDQASAIDHARRAVAAAPDAASYALALATMLDRNERSDEARDWLVGMRRRFPQNAAAATLCARVRLRLGDFAGALADAREALAIAPADQQAIAFAGIALGQLEGAAAMRQWLGLPEVVTAVDLPLPAGWTDPTTFYRVLADDIRGHSRLRYQPAGLVARQSWLTEDLLADHTAAITGFEQVLRTALEAHRRSQPAQAGHPFFGAIPGANWRINVWATRVADHGLIDTHLHVESWLSGAYYVELPVALGGADNAGWLEFNRSPPDLPAVPEEVIEVVEPRLGRIYLFPSYLHHRTLPFAGGGERISISFDLAPETL